MTLDRMKAVQVGAGDDVHYRQKYNLTQKLYTSAKEENTKMAAQLDQLKSEASSLRYAAKKAEEYLGSSIWRWSTRTPKLNPVRSWLTRRPSAPKPKRKWRRSIAKKPMICACA